MNSQKWNCAASFPISPFSPPIFCSRWGNWEWGIAVSFMEIFVSNFRYSVFAVHLGTYNNNPEKKNHGRYFQLNKITSTVCVMIKADYTLSCLFFKKKVAFEEAILRSLTFIKHIQHRQQPPCRTVTRLQSSYSIFLKLVKLCSSH